jgi:hypothetical protein
LKIAKGPIIMLKSNSRRLFHLAIGYIPMPKPPPANDATSGATHFEAVYAQYYQDVKRDSRLTLALFTTGVVLGVASNWPDKNPSGPEDATAPVVFGMKASDWTDKNASAEKAGERPHNLLMLTGGLIGGALGLVVSICPVIGVPWAVYRASTSPDYLHLNATKKQDRWSVTFFKK